MKNNIWNKLIWLPATFMALAAASCLKEPATKGDPDVPEGYGLLSLSISLKEHGAHTRSTPGLGEETGTPEENYVKAVRLVLYNNNRVRYAFDFNIRTRDPQVDGTDPDKVGFIEYDVQPDELPHLYRSNDDDHFVTYARQVQLADYKMLLIINPTKGISDWNKNLYNLTEEGGYLEDIMPSEEYGGYAVNYRPSYSNYYMPTYAQLTDEDGGIAVDNYFLMTNHRGLIDVPADRLRTNVQSSNDDPVRVTVSRAVAKVIVTENVPQVTGNAYANNFKWELDVTNQYTYWVRVPTFLITTSGAVGAMEPEYDPNDPNGETNMRKFLYGRDPNFQGLSNAGAPDPLNGWMTGEDRLTELHYQRWRQFNYLAYNDFTDNYPPEQPELTPALTLNLGDKRYCLENTMDLSDQYDGVITSAVISCNYWPAGYESKGGYYVYNNYYVSPADMQAFALKGKAIPSALEGLAADIEALLADAQIDLTQTQTQSFDSNNIRYYHAGLNYYSVKVEHSGTPGYGQYGVLRNNVYRVTLNRLLGPGSPTAVNPDPYNIAAEIKVLPWWDRLQEVEL